MTTATERMVAEQLVPALGQLLVAIQRVTVALALDAYEGGKLPPPRRRSQSKTREQRPRRNRRSR